MTRSTRTSTVTSTRASRSAHTQRKPSDSSVVKNSTTRQSPSKSSPRSGAQSRSQQRGADKQNGDESDEDSSEEEDEKPSRATRGTPNRKRQHDLESPQHKKTKLAKGASNGTAVNGVDDTDSSEEDSPRSERSKLRTQNGSKEPVSSPKKSNGNAKGQTQVTKKANSSQAQSKNTKKKASKQDSDSSLSTSEDEVIFSGTSRVTKKKAVESPTARKEYEDQDLEEITDSEEEDDEEDEEDEDVEEISSDNEEEDEEDDEDDDEVQVIEMGTKQPEIASSSNFNITQDITITDMQKVLKTMRAEYEVLVKQKDEEIGRLRNEVKYKDQQMEDMNDLMTQNMELEAKISAILGSPDVYKTEVAALSEKKAKSPEKKEKISKDNKQEIAANKGKQNTPSKVKESPAGKGKETVEKKEKAKPKPSINSTGSDSDIEVITEESPKEKTSKRKRRSSVVEVQDENDEPITTDVKRSRRSRRTKVIEEETEKIEALFVSDDEDEDVEEVKKGKKTKGKKEDKVVEEQKGKKEKDTKEGDDEAEDDKDKGRHKIRKLMADKKLKEETKAAAKEEKERLERVAKLKEKHQIVSHVDSKTKQPVYTKMVLAFKKDEKTPLVEVNSKLLKKLKTHQVEGVEFLWDSMIETVDAAKRREPGSGCILAHCMGLGKTLSVITYVHTLLTHKVLKLKTCLVVCPLNTVLNWQYEWQKWLDKKDRLPTYEMASTKDIKSRTELLQKWQKEGGIMIMGYSLFRILATSTTKSKKKKKILDDTLNDPGADIIVCDEGHILKNDASAISKCMNKVRSKRRIILTGTPLQNNLIEYHCMVSFVKPNLLGTRREFSNRFVNPITNGQHADSTLHDVKVMKRRAHVLHKMLSGCVQRRDYSALTKFLPPKYEYILSIRLAPLQIQLYEKYLEKHQNNANPMFRGSCLFSDYQALMRVWTHPWVLKMDEIRQEKKMTYCDDDDDELGSYLASETSEEEEEEDETTSKSSNEASESEAKEESEEELAPRRTRRSTSAKETEIKDKAENGKRNRDKKTKEKEKDSDSDLEEIFPDGTVRKAKLVAGEVIKHWQTNSRRKGADEVNPDAKRLEEQWWTEFIKEDEHKQKLELSGKLVLLMDILRMSEGLGDKVLVFSQSLLSLDLIEDFLSYKNEEAEKLREGKKGKSANSIPLWKKDEDYCRMDGSTSAQNRSKQTNTFNCIKNKRMRLFLISTKAGGLGINLDSANRVIIFDASWNPSHDIQSIFRAYRFGQEKDVFIYRFLAQGTMEEKIYERQVTKETLSQRVIDEHQLDRHFTAHDLQELYRFQPDRLDDPDRKERPTPKVPKDVVLAELLSDRKEWLVGYHEHDSLLEKRPDEDLNEEERKAAWDDYEKEKQGFMYHYKQQQSAVTTYNYNYRPNLMNTYTGLPNMNLGLGSASQPITVPGAGGAGLSVPGGGLLPLVAPPAGFSSEQAKLNFQLSQLPRVVQEILKYNPDITPAELQTRLRAFMGMHTKYSNVPGFAMPEIFVNFTDGRKQIVIKKLNNPQLVGQPGVAMPATTSSATTSSASVSSQAALAAAVAFAEPATTASTSTAPYPVSLPATPSPAQLSAAITSSIASAATGAMPSRLPLPGRVPASQR